MTSAEWHFLLVIVNSDGLYIINHPGALGHFGSVFDSLNCSRTNVIVLLVVSLNR